MKLMQTKYIKILMAVWAVAAVEAVAQEKINRDVKVVREYTPTVSDAFKVNQMPVVDDTVSVRPGFNYRILSTSVAADYHPNLITPAKIQTERRQNLLKTFVKGGVGAYRTLTGEIGYNILESEEFLLGLNIGHVSSFGELKLENDKTVDAPFHDTWANAGFKYFFDDKTFSVDMGFMHNMYRYYGLQTLDNETLYYLPFKTDPVEGSLLQHDVKQRLSCFDIKARFKNNVVDDRKTAFDAGLMFSTFGNMTGVKQNGFKLDGVVRQPVNDMMFELGAGVESYKTSIPDSVGPMFSFNDRSLTLIQAAPSVNFTFDNLALKVGMIVGGAIDTEEDEFFVAPDIMANLTVVEGIVSLYAGLNGHMNLNDYRSVVYENQFVSPDANVRSSLYGLNMMAGIEGNFSSSTSFSAGLEYGFFNDEHFYVNRYYADQPLESSTMPNLHYSNLFMPVYDDGSLLKVKGQMLFHPKKDVELLLHGTYFGWNLDTQEEAWHKPEFEVGIKGSFAFNQYLNFNGSLEYLGERKAYDAMADGDQKTLDGVFDLNLGADYHFSKQWTFWANINNIAASRYYKWNGYPSQRLNVMAGVIYSF